MKKFLSMLLTLVMIMAFAAPLGTLNVAAANTRYMEYLDRGVVAIRNGSSVFVSWRLLVSDDPYVGFNVYRTTDGATVQLNSEPLYGGTNFTDTTADLSKNNTYFVKTVLRGVERDTDGSYTLAANSGSQYISIPIKAGGTIHFVWVGDFNGDGKYDYLLDRLWGETQLLEAYLHDGTYLWTIDLGYNSTNTNNIEPGPSTIDVGMWDGATIYDIDCDGYADVLLRVADGVVYGDGRVHSNSTTNG
ncbi:MAG: cellulosome protein dockerin type I, partial [Clostridia bacterium]|nr:cellulosome protein dockerin type I [Clostridia bacterium]